MVEKVPGHNDLYEVAVDLVHETSAAWLVSDGHVEVWVPKSQCEYEDGILTAPEWLLAKKDLL